MVYSVPCITFLVKQDTTLRSDWLIIYELKMSEWHCGIHVVKTKHSTWWDQSTVIKTEQYIHSKNQIAVLAHNLVTVVVWLQDIAGHLSS